ncbi:hypothetical protein A3Q56_03042 [Intoshia linei]|uniref:Glycine cleavage system H protein n=1 Tax=Intoshia linei TaxID=1819745 RepID=A0A177B527_9BILA|nr:hypothetical protein A3Q56_03042 [Intoshia linei]
MPICNVFKSVSSKLSVINRSLYSNNKKLLNCGKYNNSVARSIYNSSSNVRFTKDHLWIRSENSQLVIGITDYLQNQLGDIVYVQLPDVGVLIKHNNELLAIESAKAATGLSSPFNGEVIETNELIESKPSVINKDCYGQGWLLKLKVEDYEEKNFLILDKYNKYTNDSS